MKPYLLSLAAGLLVGAIYSLLGVRSPAPPAIALVGLLGILLGEQMIPLAKRMASHPTTVVAYLRCEAKEHIFGKLPGGGKSS
jgi:XapX domain-containing protein